MNDYNFVSILQHLVIFQAGDNQELFSIGCSSAKFPLQFSECFSSESQNIFFQFKEKVSSEGVTLVPCC